MEKISLSPIEVKQIEGRTHDDRISRLEQFIISKLDNYMAPNEINTLNNETLLLYNTFVILFRDNFR